MLRGLQELKVPDEGRDGGRGGVVTGGQDGRPDQAEGAGPP